MLRAIAPKDIALVWERVRAGLIAVKVATTDDWLPEDVYMSIKNAGSVLFIGEDAEGKYLGFLVMRLIPTFHSARLDIWCAYSATKTPLMRLVFPEIKELALQAGASKITFGSSREEWQAGAARLGFVPAQVDYEFTL